MIDGWDELTPRQRLAALDLLQATMRAELDKTAAALSAELAAKGVPARIEVEVRLVVDPNRDPRLER